MTEIFTPPPPDELLRQRLAALLLTIPGNTRNYTVALDDAGWLVKEAERLGWKVTVE